MVVAPAVANTAITTLITESAASEVDDRISTNTLSALPNQFYVDEPSNRSKRACRPTFQVSFKPEPHQEEEKWAQLDWLMDGEETQDVLQKWHAFEMEAEIEIRRSRTLWHDTARSRSISKRT
jgi:hypothetical protein